MNEIIDALFLQYLTFFPVQSLRTMVERAGGKAAFRALPSSELFSLGIEINLSEIDQFETVRSTRFLTEELKKMKTEGIRYLPEEDQYLMVYHRHKPDLPNGNARFLCIDRMDLDENGDILPVTMTENWTYDSEAEK